MKLVIDISEETYKEIIDDAEHSPRNLNHYERIIARGTPQPHKAEKVGKWKKRYGDSRTTCPFCNALNFSKYKNFCPSCGAKMDGGE